MASKRKKTSYDLKLLNDPLGMSLFFYNYCFCLFTHTQTSFFSDDIMKRNMYLAKQTKLSNPNLGKNGGGGGGG